jgi:hypothetical protein
VSGEDASLPPRNWTLSNACELRLAPVTTGSGSLVRASIVTGHIAEARAPGGAEGFRVPPVFVPSADEGVDAVTELLTDCTGQEGGCDAQEELHTAGGGVYGSC